MSKEKVEFNEQENMKAAENTSVEENDAAEDVAGKATGEENEETAEKAESGDEKTETEKLQVELTEFKDKYLRLYSEFENFRRRTSREKLEMVKTANESLVVSLLPVIDDFERAQKAHKEKGEELDQGMELIINKFKKALESKGVKPMGTKAGDDFDPEVHEAITQIPAPEEKLKGKIVDVIEKGYTLEEKVIRYAKVVIGS
ncbi:nucleotide exchange factor GrpE [Roseivirga sp. BDSF3-8]|uniref:nucleotide exchange factor GrpE n=1 Tax=Roseivirga sp. BDSF3-8 TaxID=3241598 RepID=UPI003531A808